MAGIFGNGVQQGSQPQQYSGPQAPYMQTSGYGQTQNNGAIYAYPTTSRENVEVYPVPANSTAVFINYSGRKLWIKTEHANGLAHDIEEMILFTPSELQQYTQQLQNKNPPAPKAEYVSKEDFEALKKQFEEFIK